MKAMRHGHTQLPRLLPGRKAGPAARARVGTTQRWVAEPPSPAAPSCPAKMPEMAGRKQRFPTPAQAESVPAIREHRLSQLQSLGDTGTAHMLPAPETKRSQPRTSPDVGLCDQSARPEPCREAEATGGCVRGSRSTGGGGGFVHRCSCRCFAWRQLGRKANEIKVSSCREGT